MEIKIFNNIKYISLSNLVELGFDLPKRGTQLLKIELFNQFLSVPPDTELTRYYGAGMWGTSSVSPFGTVIGLKYISNDRLFIEFSPNNFEQKWASN